MKTMVMVIIFLAMGCTFTMAAKIDPPWELSPAGGPNFTVPGIENVPDLYGDIVNPDLVVFFGGNEFMVIPELIAKFRLVHPQYKRIYYQTLPPGTIEEHLKSGNLVVGNLKIELKPDVFTSGKNRTEKLHKEGLLDEPVPYAKNKLSIMVKQGNPKQIRQINDLGKDAVRISMPGDHEDISKKIKELFAKSGGKELVDTIVKKKHDAGSTYITKIHHRETPVRIMRDESDAGPVWLTEAIFQKTVGNPIDVVEIPEKENESSTSYASKVKGAAHSDAADAFIKFLQSYDAIAIFKKFGFSKPE